MNVYIGTSGELKNAYIGEYKGYTPGSNTVMYYPFNDNQLDVTGNTTVNGTFVKNGIGFSPSTYTKIAYSNFDVNYVNYRLMIKSYPSSGNLSIGIDGLGSGYYLSHNESRLNKKIYTFYNSSYSASTASWQPQVNSRHNISIGYDGTKMIYSIDGVVNTLYNGKGYNLNKRLFFNVADYVISNLICESVCWTAQEIQDYYNNTKSIYGL